MPKSEESIQKDRERTKRWIAEHKEHVAKYQKQYRETHKIAPEKAIEYALNYRNRHLDDVKAKQREYSKKRYHEMKNIKSEQTTEG